MVASELLRLAGESRDVHVVGARYVPTGVKPPEHAIGTPLSEVSKKPGQGTTIAVTDDVTTRAFDVVSPQSKVLPTSRDPGVLSPGVYRKRVVSTLVPVCNQSTGCQSSVLLVFVWRDSDRPTCACVVK